LRKRGAETAVTSERDPHYISTKARFPSARSHAVYESDGSPGCAIRNLHPIGGTGQRANRFGLPEFPERAHSGIVEPEITVFRANGNTLSIPRNRYRAENEIHIE
jgi:hypothetical protein